MVNPYKHLEPKLKKLFKMEKELGIDIPRNVKRWLRKIVYEGDPVVEEAIKFIKEFTMKYRAKPTLRSVFYYLFSKRLIPNTRRHYNELSQRLVAARMIGLMDWDALSDKVRKVELGDYEFIDPKHYVESEISSLENAWKYYHLPKWYGQKNAVEVWIEKEAMLPFFRKILRDWNVKIRVCKGYPSWTFIYQAVSELKEYKGRKVIILYFGDFDPSGVDISRFITHALKYFGIEVEFKRVAVLREHIEKYNLPPKPEDAETLEKNLRDPRASKFIERYGQLYVVELDAMLAYCPDEFADLIKSSVAEYFNKEVYERVKKLEGEYKQIIKSRIEDILKCVGDKSKHVKEQAFIKVVKERKGKVKVKGKVYTKREGYLQLTLPVEWIGKKVEVRIKEIK